MGRMYSYDRFSGFLARAGAAVLASSWRLTAASSWRLTAACRRRLSWRLTAAAHTAVVAVLASSWRLTVDRPRRPCVASSWRLTRPHTASSWRLTAACPSGRPCGRQTAADGRGDARTSRRGAAVLASSWRLTAASTSGVVWHGFGRGTRRGRTPSTTRSMANGRGVCQTSSASPSS